MTKERDENGKIPRITKTCKVVLVGPDASYPVGEFTITEPKPGPTLEQFADAAFRAARSSLARLMTPYYRLVVKDGDYEEPYGLEKWIKLVDREKEREQRLEGKGKKQPIRKRAP